MQTTFDSIRQQMMIVNFEHLLGMMIFEGKEVFIFGETAYDLFVTLLWADEK